MGSEFDDVLGIEPQSEKAIVNETLVELSKIPDSLPYRNNTGQAWQGRRLDLRAGMTLVVQPGMVVLAEARPVKFGLEGSGDIMGAVQGIPLAVELKAAKGRQRQQQANFQAAWERAGGLYVLARSAFDAIAAIQSRLTS